MVLSLRMRKAGPRTHPHHVGSMKLQFLGAADGVTGSRHLLDAVGARILLDCGLFQGIKAHRLRNWQPLAVPPASINAVVLSHAHIDHSGWLPVLVRDGFRGPVYASPATCDVAALMLLDSAHLQEEDARRANRGGWSKHQPARPLYTVTDAKRAIERLVALPVGRTARVGDALVELIPSGHLLGASAVSVRAGGQRLVYSGDVGRDDDPLMPPPAMPGDADIVLVESTYGNRTHPVEDAEARLGEVIRATAARGGSVLIPTFAVGRAQTLLLYLQNLRKRGAIPPSLPILLDSPMAQHATLLYQQHRKLLRVPARTVAGLTDGVRIISTSQQSKASLRLHYPRVILSASGMATGGRVLHHLAAMAGDARNHILFPGFQVAGTRGSHLVAGATEVKIFGQYLPVRATVTHLRSLSAHADANGLMHWLSGFTRPPRHVFVVHGEPEASDALRLRIVDTLGCKATVPEFGATQEV
jgi:metallo-beta-lactamase family protein